MTSRDKNNSIHPNLCFLTGTKRKNEHSDIRDLKRPRPSSRQGPSRSSSNNKRSSGPHLSSSSSKKLSSSPRGRHAGTSSYCHDYYDERKGRRGSRDGTRSRGGEDMRRRESHRGLESISQVSILLIQLSLTLNKGGGKKRLFKRSLPNINDTIWFTLMFLLETSQVPLVTDDILTANSVSA